MCLPRLTHRVLVRMSVGNQITKYFKTSKSRDTFITVISDMFFQLCMYAEIYVITEITYILNSPSFETSYLKNIKVNERKGKLC